MEVCDVDRFQNAGHGEAQWVSNWNHMVPASTLMVDKRHYYRSPHLKKGQTMDKQMGQPLVDSLMKVMSLIQFNKKEVID